MPITKAKGKKKVTTTTNRIGKKQANWLPLIILLVMLIGLTISVLLANQVQDLRQFASDMLPTPAQQVDNHGGDSLENFLNGRTEDQKPLPQGSRSRALCIGSGSDGPRVQVIFGYGLDQQNTIGEWLPIIRGAADGASTIFDESAKKTGGRRVVRYVTTPDCQIDVRVLQLPMKGSDLDDFDKVKSYLQKQKFLTPNKNILIFVDNLDGQFVGGVACGWGDLPYDDSPGWKNKSNKGGNLALVKKYCWSETLAAHELMHNFGAVQAKAPNWNGVAHCTDDHDIMCYSEAGGRPMRDVCVDILGEHSFDCNNDDYYSLSPSGYLSDHWNSAFSIFLDDPTRDAKLSIGSGGKDGVNGNEKVSISLSGFQPNEKVALLWNDSKVLKDVTNDSNGSMQGNFTTPNANQGQFTLVARGSYGTYAEISVSIKKDKKDDKKKNNNNDKHKKNNSNGKHK